MNNQKIFIAAGVIALVVIGILSFQSKNTSNTSNPITGTAVNCYIGGCSGEVCSSEKDVASNCIYKPEFACYKNATCEVQKNGQCGWTQTATLRTCLNSPNKTDTATVGYVTGHVTIGPNCPVERVDQSCPTPAKAYSSREVIVYGKDGVTQMNQELNKIDVQGNYKISLPPGSYYLQIQPAGIGPGEKKLVTVKSSQTSTVNFDIDTGIR